MRISQLLPPHWCGKLSNAWLDAEVEGPSVSCGLCPRQSDFPSRCCDHFPYVPNFLILKLWGDSRWTEQFDSWWKEGDVLTPLGLIAPHGVQSMKHFGQWPSDYRCPFLSKKNSCEIWTLRPGECAGHWCEAKDFVLSQSLKSYINYVEQSLAELWMIEAGYEIAEIEANWKWFNRYEEGDGSQEMDPKKLWAHHWTAPQRYYERAQQWFEALTQRDIEDLLGANGTQRMNNSLTSLTSRSKTETHEQSLRPAKENHSRICDR